MRNYYSILVLPALWIWYTENDPILQFKYYYTNLSTNYCVQSHFVFIPRITAARWLFRTSFPILTTLGCNVDINSQNSQQVLPKSCRDWERSVYGLRKLSLSSSSCSKYLCTCKDVILCFFLQSFILHWARQYF